MTKDEELVGRALALYAFREGFKRGADPLSARKSRVFDAASEPHWKRGYQAGRRAAEEAERQYREELEPQRPLFKDGAREKT